MKPSVKWLVVFLPITIVLVNLGGSPLPIRFFSAALALIPIACVIADATAQLASRTGDGAGGLLNATFGNAPQLIIGLVALRAGYPDMVRAFLIGSILANLLLALGVAFLLGGIRHYDQRFNSAAARRYSTMMLLAAVSLGVPSAFSRYFAPEGVIRQEQALNIAIAVLLLLTYGLYLWFFLKTHAATFSGVKASVDDHHKVERWTVPRSLGGLIAASILAAWLTQTLVGAAEGTEKSLGMSPTFIGIVLLSIVGGAAESRSAIAMARKDKLDLTVGIALGRSIQIALFVAPVVVLASYFIAPQPLGLSFRRSEVGALFLGTILGTIVCRDGQANWFKGIQLLAAYSIFALMFLLMPAL